MDATLGLRIRNTLHSMATAFILKMTKYFTPRHTYYELFEPAKFGRTGIHDLNIPSCLSRVPTIHFKKVANKECGLISARAC